MPGPLCVEGNNGEKEKDDHEEEEENGEKADEENATALDVSFFQASAPTLPLG